MNSLASERENVTHELSTRSLRVHDELRHLMTGSLSNTDYLLEIKRLQEVVRNAFVYEERVMEEYRYATWFHLVDHVDVMTLFANLVKTPSKSNIEVLLRKLDDHIDYHDVLFANHYDAMMLKRA